MTWGTGVGARLLTNSGQSSTRLRVDPGQTGFFAGRMFRSYVELNIPTAGPAVSVRFTSPVDFILWEQALILHQGAFRLGRITSGSARSQAVLLSMTLRKESIGFFGKSESRILMEIKGV